MKEHTSFLLPPHGAASSACPRRLPAAVCRLPSLLCAGKLGTLAAPADRQLYLRRARGVWACPLLRDWSSGPRRQAQAGSAAVCSLGGEGHTVVSRGERAPCSYPVRPPILLSHASQPRRAHRSWICRSHCCCAAISFLCRCTWPERIHMRWLCLSV